MDFLGSVNLFHGRIDAGKAIFWPPVLDHDSADLPDGHGARLFVRPFELDILHHQNGSPGLKARVTRIQSAGSLVRVELLSEHGETVNVEMPHARFRERAVELQQEVFVTLLDSRVFTERR